jgi:ferric-dicitrate binding protein FerR (iron transport regulator)
MKNEKEILKWFNNELSGKEIEDLKQSEDLQTLEKINHYASQFETPKVDVHAKKKPKVRTLNYKVFYRVAAVLTIVLTSAYFLFSNNVTSFETSIAQTKSVMLPDHSQAILNSASKLSFNEKKWAAKRDLTLEGEAFFRVKKGQAFSVKQRKNYFEVTCYEGLVSVAYKQTAVKLPPGKTFRVINGTIEAVEDFNAKKPSWLEKESSFDKIPLDQVIAELERQYDIKIKTEGVDTSKLFTGSFTHTNKQIALQAVTIPLKLSYRIEGETVIFYNYGLK